MRAELLAAAIALSLVPTRALAWCQMTTSDLSPTAAEPCILAENHPGEHPLAWRRRCTSLALSTVDASEDLSDAEVRSVLGRAIASWEQVRCDGAAPGLDIEVLAETTVVNRARHFANGRNVNAVIFVHSGWEDRGHDRLALAVTYVWHDPSTGEIFDGDIELNEDTNTFVSCPAIGCPAPVMLHSADLGNTLTHEIGHYFGIAHTPDDLEATMWAMASPGETKKRSLAPDDEEALCGIYPPGALNDACDYTPRGGLGLDGAPPPGCGCAAPGAGRGGLGAALLGLALAGALARRARRES